jgi:hypothetical protein
VNPISNPRTGVVIVALLLIPLWTVKASAQTPAPSASATQAAPAAYRSALEGYQPYTDEKTGNWKEANDTTARIGGWREYAKEASQPESGAKPPAPDAAAKPDPRAVPAKPGQEKP